MVLGARMSHRNEGGQDDRLLGVDPMHAHQLELERDQVRLERHGWAIRFWLDRERRLRERTMFDLAIDSKLRGCDVVKVKIGDVVSGGRVRSRAIVVQQKPGRPVQFRLLQQALR
jgi:hypothetical protein